MMTFVKGEDTKYKWNGTKKNHDKDFYTDAIENYQNGYRGKGKDWHPQAIPLDFTKMLIEIFSNKNDLVLDMFSGAGTTAVASRQLERDFIAFEYKEEYYTMSKNRLERLKIET